MFINSTYFSFKSALRCLLFILLPLFAKANLGITPITTQVGNEVTVDFLVYNLNNILSMQYTVHWDPTVMAFESLEDFGLPTLSASNYGVANAQQLANGNLTHSWYSPDLTSLTLPDCSTIYRVKFTSLNGQVSPISIVGTPTAIEVVTANFMQLDIEMGLNCNTLGQIRGIVFLDSNGNCTKDDGEATVKDCAVQLEQSGLTYTLPVGEDGGYYFLGQAGDHTLSLMLPDQSGLQACTAAQTIELTDDAQVELNFGVVGNGVSSTKTAIDVRDAKVSPNPARAGQLLYWEPKQGLEAPVVAQLFSGEGKVLQQWKLAGTTTAALSSSLMPGLYFLKIMDAQGGHQTVKLIIE
ncbi:MAG: T9SS type A sorting domain-containing protein [Saprospiraceae bacterium]|nr:T9SS type A sorting domain-containing protein [Saprospiraceae bacterium]